MQKQRFEFKYNLEESKALAVRDFLASYLELDEAGQGKHNRSYRVNSLYLDSPGLDTFWDWVNADRNRFKLRMRFYEPQPDTPVYLEIKRRVSNCILKQRCAIRKSAAPLIMLGQFPPEDAILSRDARGRVALENFITLVSQLQARTVALVTYLREAYIDPTNEGVRVTMDRQVRIAPRTELDFNPHPTDYVQPFGDKVILELKFNNRAPDWFHEMARALELTRSAAAKYCEGVATIWRPQLSNCRPRVKALSPSA